MNGSTIAHWSTAAIDQLRDTQRCPVCRTADLVDARCPSCGATLSGESGVTVWQASRHAAEALGDLRQVLDRVPRHPHEAPRASEAPPASDAAQVSAPSSLAIAGAMRGPSTTLQSVLAVAGAGLVATAAFVFTFLNSDLTDPAARGIVVALATLLFVTAAPLLHRAGLRFSAESVAALALVFGSLSAAVLAELLPTAIESWAFATGAALLGGLVMLGLGLLTRLRVWMLAATITLTLVPALWSAAVGGEAATVLGPLGTAGAALLLLTGQPWAARRVGTVLNAECRVALAALLIALAVMTAALTVLSGDAPTRWLATGAALLAASLLTAGAARHGARRTMSVLAGASATAAGAFAAVALTAGPPGSSAAWIVMLPLGASIALITLGVISSARSSTQRRAVLGGSLTTLLVIVTPHTALAGFGAFGALIGITEVSEFALGAQWGVAIVGGLVVASAALALHASLLTRRSVRPTRAPRALIGISLVLLSIAALGALGLPAVPIEARIITGLVLITAGAMVIGATPLGRRSNVLLRLPVVFAGHAALTIVVALSWTDVGMAVAAAPAVLVSLAALARCVPPVLRAGHVAIGTAYALIVVAAALGMLGLDTPAQVSITATVGLLAAIVATLLPRLAASWWIAVLIVTAVPYALAVGLVAVERSGWSALSTTTMLVLALCLLGTRRPGLGVVVRTLAAALIVPAIAVVLVDLGAVLLLSSGSPVVLPIIALVVAVALVTLDVINRYLQRRGMPAPHARAATAAIEASSVLTAIIAIALSIDRPAAGLPTTLLVLIVLAAGSFFAGAVVGVARLWWIGGAASTGAIWTLWALLGVDSIEAHVLPPALGVALVGVVLTARGRPEPELVGAGLLAAIAPLVWVLALGDEPTPLRAGGLVLSALALVALAAGIHAGRPAPLRRLDPVRGALLIAAIGAASAAAVQAVRLGLAIDASPVDRSELMLLVLAISLAGAVPAALGGLLLAARTSRPRLARFGLVPALALLLVPAWVSIVPAWASISPAWVSISRDWVAIWTLWMLMLALLTLMVVAAYRQQRRATVLPPVWLLFGLALVTAIAAWSPRELRVEWFSVPLGLMLLAAGVTALRSAAPSMARGAASWPVPGTGSWPLLAPGFVVLVLASMLATATDPQTWRAVLVMTFALAAILAGARWRLAAPFVLGIIVLPIENVLAFSVQIGRGIDAMPWWITLAVAGLVLLVIAVGFERRAGDDASLAARVRDLR